MLQITAYKTRDGLIHETKENAIKHCKKVKDDALHNLRLSLQNDLKIGIQEAVAIVEFIDFHKESLSVLQAMDDDLFVFQPQEEEGH